MTTTTATEIAAAEATLIAAEKALDEALAAWKAKFDAEHADRSAISAFFTGDSDELKALQATLTARNIEAHEAREALQEARGF